jgi:hypothetical protein
MIEKQPRIALLIDADNSPSSKIDVILAELAKLGVVNVRRAYGNWKKDGLKGWENVLHEYAIRPIQQFDYTKGKNATDMGLVIDALDLLYSDSPDAFGIVSSDSDFTPLVMHLRAKGATRARRRRAANRPRAASRATARRPSRRRRRQPSTSSSMPRHRGSTPQRSSRTRGSSRCCAMPSNPQRARTAGRRWVRWASRSATRPRSTRATTVTAS